MAAVKNIITAGIGASPGSLKYFLTLGLGLGDGIEVVEIRSIEFSLTTREVGFALTQRGIEFGSLTTREAAFVLE